MRLNPLTYGLTGLREALYWGHAGASARSLGVSLAVSVAFAAVMFLLATAVAGGRTSADLQ
jgi:hypothetical protein